MAERILLIRPCCLGDVVLATAALQALRDAYPEAHITWAVGSWSQSIIAHHPLVDAFLDTGEADLPTRSLPDFLRFVRQMRAGRFDIVISLVRSPLMSLAVRLSGAPIRAGIDSNGRGFGYSVRVPIEPNTSRHEAAIYLDVIRALTHAEASYEAHIPILESAEVHVEQLLAQHSIQRYWVVNPAGGDNPGMRFHQKRYPPEKFAELIREMSPIINADVILIAGPNDQPIVDQVQEKLPSPVPSFVGSLHFAEIGALANGASLYLGNDTGLTHLAAASGGKTAMLMGPTDPNRYAPYTADSIALWKPTELNAGGVEEAAEDWDWDRDGISVSEAVEKLKTFLDTP